MGNVPIRRKPTSAVEVRSSGVHGLGVFARRDLHEAQVVGVYEGRRYGIDTYPDRREDGLTYLFTLSDGGFIDGGEGGNATRHLNHSCEPNCVAEEFLRAGETGVRIRTLRAISAGQELFLDYALVVDPSEDATAYPCHCGAAWCRQTLVGVGTETVASM